MSTSTLQAALHLTARNLIDYFRHLLPQNQPLPEPPPFTDSLIQLATRRHLPAAPSLDVAHRLNDLAHWLDTTTQSPLLAAYQQSLQQHIQDHGLSERSATALTRHFPLRVQLALLQPYIHRDPEALRLAYALRLQLDTHHRAPGEDFPLSDIYIAPRAAFDLRLGLPSDDDMLPYTADRRTLREQVVNLHTALTHWLDHARPSDALRLLHGGPGSGKSTALRHFAAHIVQNRPALRLLLIPLHRLDPRLPLHHALSAYCQAEDLPDPFAQPLGDHEKILLLLDGADESGAYGQDHAAHTAALGPQIENLLQQYNSAPVGLDPVIGYRHYGDDAEPDPAPPARLLVLLSGRDLYLRSAFHAYIPPRSILRLLPYFLSADDQKNSHWHDPSALRLRDQGLDWWRNYGLASGSGHTELPPELLYENLQRITASPLQNHLVALALVRRNLTLTPDTTLGEIYHDAILHTHTQLQPPLPLDHFLHCLEESAALACSGNGRTFPPALLPHHPALTDFLHAAAQNRLLPILSPEPSTGRLAFTHRSFAEHLASRRLLRLLCDDLPQNLDASVLLPALQHPVTDAIQNFLDDDFQLLHRQQPDALPPLQECIALLLFALLHRHPQPDNTVPPDHQALFPLLLALHRAIARATRVVSPVHQPCPDAFAQWLALIQTRQTAGRPHHATCCLDYLDLSGADLSGAHLLCASLRHTLLVGADLTRTNLKGADLRHADLRSVNAQSLQAPHASLFQASMSNANFYDANFTGADLSGADLEASILAYSRLHGAAFNGTRLARANLRGVRADGVNLSGLDLSAIIATRAFLRSVNLTGSQLQRANLESALLTKSILINTNLKGAHLSKADLTSADLTKANLVMADLRGAKLKSTTLTGASLSGARLDKRPE